MGCFQSLHSEEFKSLLPRTNKEKNGLGKIYAKGIPMNHGYYHVRIEYNYDKDPIIMSDMLAVSSHIHLDKMKEFRKGMIDLYGLPINDSIWRIGDIKLFVDRFYTILDTM